MLPICANGNARVNELKVEDVNDDSDDEEEKTESSLKPKQTRTVTEEKWEKINSEPIWCKPSSEITEDEYLDFYKSVSDDWDKYLTLKHFKVEGNLELTGLIYIPSRAPFDLFDNKSKKNGIKLYVKKVLITDKCQDLHPEWMSFVRGIVDSQDLPLNASRELLQHNKILKQISKNLIKKTIEMLTDLSEDVDKYRTFYDNFDKNLKLGVHEETDTNRDKLVELLRYTTSQGEHVSFKQYVERMKENQPGIYFITGESLSSLENSPFVDKLKKMDYEIIYMVDPIDEYIIQHLTKYKETKLINVSKDDLSLKDSEVDVKQYESLCKQIKDHLGDRVDNVIVSTKIESQPAIVTNPMGMSANMERIMRAQALASKNSNPMHQMMLSRKNLEINPEHPLIVKISSYLSNSDNVSDSTQENETPVEQESSSQVRDLIDFVYESALLSGGYQVSDINNYLKRVFNYIN
jgi:molecular chaperone HtpG